MGIFEKDGRYSFVKRVPKRFQHVDKRRDVRIALKTDSRKEAERKAPQVEAELIAYWEALVDGRSSDAQERFDAVSRIATTQGLSYQTYDKLAEGPIEDIIQRLLMVKDAGPAAPSDIIDALTGEVLPPSITLSAALEDYYTLTRDKIAGKSEKQIRLWKLPRERCVGYFIQAVEDKDVDKITREDALMYRNWWRDKLESEDLKTATANKDFSNLNAIFRTWADLRRPGLVSPFSGLAFRDVVVTEKHPFSTDWIANKLVDLAVWDKINEDARDPFLIMINTGARPSEIVNARPEDFDLDHDIPHLKIQAADDRQLKTGHSLRDIPLLGVSLDAARRLKDRGGCKRYADNSNGWSANVNKYLTAQGLRETPDHSAYSLRHSMEDRLLEADVDERTRAQIMGHKYKKRAEYGKGATLKKRRDAIAKIAI